MLGLGFPFCNRGELLLHLVVVGTKGVSLL